jgi:glycosyltransferase involved in cell wall biosynthesis
VTISLLRLAVNRGIAGALNHGLEYILSRGYGFVSRLDAGDTIVPQRFERQIGFLRLHSDCGAVSSFVDFVDSKQTRLFRYDAPCHHAQIVHRLHINNCLVHSGVTMQVRALREVGPYRLDVPGAEDYELFLRMAKRYRLAVLPEVLTQCEYSFGGLSIVGRHRQQQERLKLQLSYFDLASVYSFYGIIRTLVAMLVPHAAVYRFKMLARQRVPS